MAENCYVETATLSTVLSNMEKRGMIERRRLDTDKRSYSIYIKDEARPMFEAVKRKFDKTLKLAFSGFSDKEADEFRNYLKRVEENLKNG